MKLAPLLVVPAVSLEASSTAHNLLAAVGHRNATKMEALVQGLAEESISEPGWKFDKDIQDALEAIRSMFVLNIQKALKDQHKEDQEHMNCFTQDCFGGCVDKYKSTIKDCHDMDHKCHGFQHEHVVCRHKVKGLYIDMGQSCGKLHSFILGWEPEVCPDEKCMCPDLLWCHRKEGYSEECVSNAKGCKYSYGSWIMGMIDKYTAGYAEWSKLYKACKVSYHAFLTMDMQCDGYQKEFEQCMCEKNRCESTGCTVEYEQCREGCWTRYEELVFEKECLEKDRKIDWSATKKIECYVDILLHDYTKEELLSKCGSETCINDAREADYKFCHTICLEVDHDGKWPSVVSAEQNPVIVDGHKFRKEASKFLLGDGHFKCDANGAEVFTKHRGGASREDEKRCTEHLDIDYQVPQCVPCDPEPDPVCDAKFHKKWYFQFDDTSRIPEISDCCFKGDSTCFPDVIIDSSHDGNMISWITVGEHSHAWGYNRCRCTPCIEGYPVYPPPPLEHQCGNGAHTLRKGGYEVISGPPRTVQSSWDNHFAAFGAQDVPMIMRDYTEASVLESYDFPNGNLVTAKGLVEIRKFFTDLFALLSDTSGLTAPLLQVTSPHDQVFLTWTCPTSGVKTAADTFFFAEDNTILRQNIVWTHGMDASTVDGLFTVAQQPAFELVKMDAAYSQPSVQPAWDNHFSAFGAFDVEKIMQDYTEKSELRAYDHRTQTVVEANGLAQIQQFFADLFKALHGTSFGGTAPVVHVSEAPASKQVYLVWTDPNSGITSATDSFLFGKDNKILRQNIAFTSTAAFTR